MENWKQNPRVFWTLGIPPSFWLLAFFIIPLGFLFVMSFSDKAMVDGQVSITGYDYLTGITNYVRAFDRLYLGIMWFLRNLFVEEKAEPQAAAVRRDTTPPASSSRQDACDGPGGST